MTTAQLRGMLLEEAVLYLLRNVGYDTVDDPLFDPDTLQSGRSGLEVRGRGAWHQIDAIADFILPAPFSHPQRLLTEAKCLDLKKKAGLEIVRNAVGVLKDVSECWVSSGSAGIAKGRYHYQYAVFSASGYTDNAERYAFAQDIYLIPLAKSSFLKPLVDSIYEADYEMFGLSPDKSSEARLSELRKLVRKALTADTFDGALLTTRFLESNYVKLCRETNNALLIMLGKRFPVFLVPEKSIKIEEIQWPLTVRVKWNEKSWYLCSADQQERKLFSFDLPERLFHLYADEGILTPKKSMELKRDNFDEITSFFRIGTSFRVIKFELEKNWFNEIWNVVK